MAASGGYVAWVENPLPGPVQVRLRARASGGYESVPALPADAVLAAGERRALARLYRVDGDAAGLGLEVEVVPGDPHALPDGQVYQLPFAGVPVRVDQGFEGSFSHHDAANRYALDFALPEGTPVLAAREGLVLQVESGFHEGGSDRDRDMAHANLIRVLHRDGSMAVYAHLAADGIVVRPGQSVRAGEPLARSGQTGFSTAPHLHFGIQVNAGLRLAAIPFRMRGPLGELQLPRALAAEPAAP
ncbi:MAG TPA: M23 family metallopeptidase [Stenotrophomonas sp.]|nr:M23 family metallopeptidase [Stenotrophomonas sp.]